MSSMSSGPPKRLTVPVFGFKNGISIHEVSYKHRYRYCLEVLRHISTCALPFSCQQQLISVYNKDTMKGPKREASPPSAHFD